jgi:signal transduction histidine kinase
MIPNRPLTRRRFRFSIRAKMLVAFVGLTLIPMLILGALLSYPAERLLRERISRELQVEVDTAADALEVYLKGVRRDVLSLSRFLQNRLQAKMTEAQWRTVEEEFLQTIRTEQAYYQIRFITVDGMEAIRVNNDRGELSLVPGERLQYKGDRYYFRKGLATDPGGVYLSPLDFNVEHGRIEEPKRLVVRLAAAVTDSFGAVRGLIVINVFGEEMLQALERLKTEPQTRVLLINEDCSFVEKRRESRGEVFHTGTKEDLQPFFGSNVQGVIGQRRVSVLSEHLLAEAPVNAGPERVWQLVKVYPREEIFSDLRRLHRSLLVFSIPLAFLAAAAAVFAARSFSRPIRRLSSFSDRVAQGDYDQRIVVSSGDELGRLADSLNAMAASLSDSRERLLEWNRNLQEEVERQLEARRQSEAEADQFRRGMQSLEKQLIAADRLASLGMLSATVAHEIGNPLAGLRARLQMLRRKTEDPSVQGDLDRLLELVERLGMFLRQLTGYLGPGAPDKLVSVDLCQVLRDLAFILREDAERRGASLHLDIPSGPLHVCSRGQHLHQIFMNLILNACQAVGEGGQIRVTAARTGGWVRVEVADNGPGISDDSDRLFEPLFTTKEQGTGLGLAIVRKLTEELGGTVTLRNRPDRGSIAEVTLPERNDGCRTES